MKIIVDTDDLDLAPLSSLYSFHWWQDRRIYFKASSIQHHSTSLGNTAIHRLHGLLPHSALKTLTSGVYT